jgi:hypothetical protein
MLNQTHQAQQRSLAQGISTKLVYVVAPGRTVSLWVYPDVTPRKNFLYEPSPEVAGSGVVTRWFTMKTPSRVRSLVVVARSGNEDDVVLKRIPVDYIFK